MSWEKHDDQCPGCLPALADPTTMKALPKDHPAMKAIMSVWQLTTKEEREAFHEFTCNNSRDPKVMSMIAIIQKKFEAALEFATKE